MGLRILVDESLPRSVGTALATIGADVIDARDVGLSGADDPQVFAHAQQDARTLASRDVDFADTIAYPIGTHHGIVVARIPSKRPLAAVADAFVRALNGLEPSDVQGCLFIIDEHRVRARRPPPP